MAYSIIKDHGGRIECSTEPGKGTTFEVSFPALMSPGEPVRENLRDETLGRDETILLIDDEGIVRDMIKRTLKRFSFRVMAARDCESAPHLYAENMERIDLVILDVIMPGMGGVRCLGELMKINPEVKVVVISGFNTETTESMVLGSGAKSFLSKPYLIQELLDAIRTALNEGGN